MPGGGAGVGAVSWLRTWWRQVAGAGAGCRCRCCELVARVVETGCRRALVLGAGCRCWCWWWWRQVAGTRAHTFARVNLYAQDHTALSFCRSLLQACYKVNSGAGTAWPWANDSYGLCCLRAYFCAHKLIRARSCYSPNRDGYGVLAANKNELAARAFEVLLLWSWALAL